MSWSRRAVMASAALAALAPRAVLAAADLAGDWSGTWTKAGDSLPVTVHFAHGPAGWTATFDSADLEVAAIPFSEVTYDPPKLRLALSGDATTSVFDGAVDGDVISGGFTEAGVQGGFRLVRQTRPAPAVAAADVSVRNGEVALAGTLLLPAKPGRHPAILFLHGSGGEGRWAARYLAQSFAEAGFAALVTDKRGVGASSGDWRTSGFEDLASDAAAWIGFLRSRPEVDPARVGIYGHSQGGTIAPLVAGEDGRLGFVIASAAGGVAPADMEFYSVVNSIRTPDLSPEELVDAASYVRMLVDVAYRGRPRAELDLMASRFKSRSWYFDPPPPGDVYWAFAARTASYDPIAQWRQVRAPVLLLYGDKDARVPVGPSAMAIQAALAQAGDRDVTLRIFPGVDHTFRYPAAAGGWPKRAPDYVETMIVWARARTGD